MRRGLIPRSLCFSSFQDVPIARGVYEKARMLRLCLEFVRFFDDSSRRKV